MGGVSVINKGCPLQQTHDNDLQLLILHSKYLLQRLGWEMQIIR